MLVPLFGEACTACAAAQRGEESYLRWFMAENYNQRSTYEGLEEAALCRLHGARLLEAGDVRLSWTFRPLVRAELESLDRKRRRRHEPAPCPACHAGREAARVAVLRLADQLDAPLGREAYARGGGLCRAHLRMLQDQAGRELAGWLRQDLARRLELLLARLHECCYGRPRAEDMMAWQEAMRYFWGEVDAPPAVERGRPPSQRPGSTGR